MPNAAPPNWSSFAKFKTFANLGGINLFNRLRFAEDMTETEPQNRTLGYARVSTYGQTLDAQLEQLKAAGCAKTYREKATGAKVERRELQRLLKAITPGDVVTVTRIDRLARSTRDLLKTLATVAERKAGFRSLGDAWADTTSAHGRLMLTVLGGLAEFERELIRARTGEGRERAKARGVKMGRPPKMTPHQMKEALRRRDAGEPMRDIARSYNVSHSTISRLSA